MDGKRAAPHPGRRVVFFLGGVCTCRAGPMCPAEKCIPGGGAHGPRPTGRYVEPRVGDGVLDVPTARRCRAVRPPLGGGCRRSRLGERKRVASLPPSALRADTSLSEGGEGRRIPTPVCALARNDSASRCLGGQSTRRAGHTGPALQDGMLNRTKRDVEDAVPYGRGAPSPTGFYPVISTRVPSLSSTQLS